MPIKLILNDQKKEFDKLAGHPLQSFAWGDFREKTGVKVVKLGQFENDKLIACWQMTLHQMPYFPYTIGYIPKSSIPNKEVLAFIKNTFKQTIFVKFEPQVLSNTNLSLITYRLSPSYRPLFTKYTFHIDLTQSEDQLLKNMHPKTRYNIRVAQKHGVTIQEENTEETFEKYLELTRETTKRQGFYAHDEKYHRLMWQTLQPAGLAHLFTARYQGKILTTWILFLFNHVLYYPYGASSSENKNVMASTLMMWETMRWGKKMGAKIYDLWGTPGPDPAPTDDYYGFHRFKLGFGPKLVEFVGSYDLILKQPHYTLFKYANLMRWKILKLKTRI